MTTTFIAEGRIVWGHPAKGNKAVNMRTQQPKLNKHNQEYEEFAFGVAVEKNKFNAECWPHIYQEGATFVPHCLEPGAFEGKDFSWKFKDADITRDKNGKLYSEYEGRAGCMILAIKTSAFAPSIYKWDGAKYEEIQPEHLKCGDWVAVAVSCEFNGSNGVYMNPEAVTLIRYDDEIRSTGADPTAIFAGYTPTAVVGQPTLATTAPMPGVAPVAPVAPIAAPVAPVAPIAAPVAPVAPIAAPVAPVALPLPAHDFVTNAGQTPIPGVIPGR